MSTSRLAAVNIAYLPNPSAFCGIFPHLNEDRESGLMSVPHGKFQTKGCETNDAGQSSSAAVCVSKTNGPTSIRGSPGTIKRGLVVYVCFLKGADPEVVEKIVKSVLGVRLSGTEEGRLASIFELPGDILIVPQATLGGRLKGRGMQYHTNIDKEMGLELYKQLVQLCEKTVKEHEQCKEADVLVKWGTYGNLQVLNLETNGPYTHILDF